MMCECLLVPVYIGSPHVVLAKSKCNLKIGRINLVQLDGASGSHIHDDIRVNAITSDNQHRQDLSVTLYDDTTYKIHVQFDCAAQSGKTTRCGISQTVNVWIDFNDNGFDDRESRDLQRTRSNSNTPRNTYDWNLYIPVIDERDTKSGSHRMRVSVGPSAKYRRECGATDHVETREYTVNIIRKALSSGKSCFYIDYRGCIIIAHASLTSSHMFFFEVKIKYYRRTQK